MAEAAALSAWNDGVVRPARHLDPSAFFFASRSLLEGDASGLPKLPGLLKADRHPATFTPPSTRYTFADLREPLGCRDDAGIGGAVPMLSIDATDFGWRDEEHSDYVSDSIDTDEIMPWYQDMAFGGDDPVFRKGDDRHAP